MADNKTANSLKLNNKKIVNCPYCGNGNRVNDFLFRTSDSLTVAEDNRLSDYYFRFYKKIPERSDFKNYWTEPKRLISWTDLPNSQVTISDSFVTSVINYDRQKSEERACIWCHNKISDEWISRAGKEVAVYAQPGTEEQASQFIENLIGDNSEALSIYKDLRCFTIGDRILYDCSSLSELDNDRRKRALMNGLASKAVLFFIKLGAMHEKEEAVDLDTLEWLRNGISDLYGAGEIHLPTLVVLIPAEGESADAVQINHKILYTRLPVHFSNYKIYPWQSAEKLASDFMETMEWLTAGK